MTDATINNQQGRLYSWLAGLIDGDGTLCMTKTVCSREKYPQYKEDKMHIRLTLKIEMADESTIRRCERIFRNMGVHTKMVQRTKRKGYGYYYSVKICGAENLSKVLKKLKPYLFTKQKQAKLMLKYIESRKHGNRHKYSDKDLKLIEKMAQMNKVPSETIRPTPDGEDIVQLIPKGIRL